MRWLIRILLVLHMMFVAYKNFNGPFLNVLVATRVTFANSAESGA